MSDTIKVKLLDRSGGRGIAVGGRKPGRIMEVPSGVGETWIKGGKAELVADVAGQEQMVPQHANREKMKRR
jgi:hypothetical protein